MYRLFLSFRFLLHHWLMTIIGSFFVGASLVILVVVMSVMDGFQAKLKETIAGSSADLTLTPRWPCDPERFAKAVEEIVPQVEVAAPFFETITMTRRAGKLDPVEQRMHYAAVYGIDAQKESRINRFREYLSVLSRDRATRTSSVKDPDQPFKVWDELEEATGTVGVIVGRGLMEELGVAPNQKIRLATAVPGKDVAGGAAPEVDLRYVQVLVVGVYQSGNAEIDQSCVFLDWRAFRKLFSADVSRGSVRCRLDDHEAADAARATLSSNLNELVARTVDAGVRVEPWQVRMLADTWKDKNRPIVQAIESEKSMILIIAFLIVVAGTSSIFAAQWLLVSDKIREIGILRALGAGVGGVVSIFVTNGFLMGVLGSVGGTLGGLLVVRNIDAVHSLISKAFGRPVFDPRVYLFTSIPTLVDYAEITRYAVAALVCTLIASAIPAARAGLMNPAEALHRE